ncbi:MAG: adenylate/guanylate cyclase domain-containing protein [Nitrospirales bacterium]|nr:AAA family ATPase [Nitrospirales bacterium]
MTFEEILDATKRLLESRKRITYGALKRQFSLDDEFLEDLKAELIKGQRVAVDEGGEVLVWTGRDEATPGLINKQGQGPRISREGQVTHQARLSTQAERRQLTVMFCDLVGSTALSERLDPEDLREVIGAYQETCDHVIHRFEGTIMQYQGDGILVYFGHPIAHEDDARRGVLAALGILDELPKLNTCLQQLCDVELSLRVGIHTGLVVVGEMGRSGWLQTVALGETLNVASRIQSLTDPNTIVISEATLNLVKGFFNTQALGEHTIKGISQPVKLWRVLKKSGVESRFEASGSRLAPLVGRENEVELVLKRWKQVKDGIGQIVMVKGEPGIGKTRLVEELKEHLKKDNPTLQEYRCSPFYQHTALYPVINLLGQWLHLGQEDSAEDKLRKLEGPLNGLKNYQPKLEAVALLANLLGVPLDNKYVPLTFTPETQRQKTLELLRDLLLETSPGRPVLFIFEDLHWVDPTTLDWLSMVIRQAGETSVLVMLTSRPGFEPPWSEQANVGNISLKRLSGIDIGSVIKGVTGGKTLPREIAEQVVSRTDGVPLFVEELTKSLLESGLLRQRGNEYELAGPLSSMTIPATLQDSLMARLDRLSTAKPVAQLGATLGREFSYELLHAVSPLEETSLQMELTRLEEAELLYRQNLFPQAKFTFKHALIQEAAYESLLKSRRRELHHHIAEILENRFSATAESEPELLAHHYTHAACPERAIPFWQRAGQRALKRSANPEAITHLGKALECLENLQDTKERRETELDLQLSLMPANMAIRGWASEEVEACCVRSRELCIELGDHQRLVGALWGLWTVHFLRAELDKALELAQQVLNMASGAGIKMLEVTGHHAVGFTKYFRGDLQGAKQHADDGIKAFELDTERQIVHAFQISSTMALRFFLSASLWFLGKPEESWQERKKTSSLIGDLNHKPSQAAFMSFELCFYLYSRDPKRMRQAVEELMKLSEEEGFLLYVPVGMMYLGWALAEEGNVEEGLQQMERGKNLYYNWGNRIKFVEILVMYAEILRKAGRMEDALRALEEGMNHANTHQERLLEPELYRIRGEILFEQGNEPAAAKALDQAIEKAQKQGATILELRAVISKCRLCKSKEKKEETRSHLRQVYDSFTEGFDTKDLLEAKNLLQELGPT